MTNCMGDTTDGNSCVPGLFLSCECVCVHFLGKHFAVFYHLCYLVARGSTLAAFVSAFSRASYNTWHVAESSFMLLSERMSL